MTSNGAARSKVISQPNSARRSSNRQSPIWFVKKIRADLHRASAFSLVFDGWTARGLRNAYIAILYSWIDENFKAKKTSFVLSFDVMSNYYLQIVSTELLDVAYLGDRRHDAYSMALLIASRVEAHTKSSQFLYSSTTDNAKSVVLAAKMLTQRYEMLLKTQ